MEERTADEVAQIFKAAGDSVTVINGTKMNMKQKMNGKIKLSVT